MRIRKTYIVFDKERSRRPDSERYPLLADSRSSDDDWQALAQARPSQQFNVVRRVYQQDALNKDADYHMPHQPLGYQCKKVVKKCGFGECLLHSLPIVRWLPQYKIKRDLMGDLIAGATTAIMHIPQGLAYALLAEVPPIVGLYMAFFPVLVYAVLGTSPHVSMGTFAVACLMTGKVVNQYAYRPPDTSDTINTTNTTNVTLADPIMLTMPAYTPLQVCSIVCITVGFYQLVMWILRLGAVSTLLSEPLVSGFTTAAAIHVMASQLKDLLGVKIPKLPTYYKVVNTVIEIFKQVPNTNLAALVISAITCTVIALNNELLKPWVSKRCKVPVPIELLAIIAGTLAAKFGDLINVYELKPVGPIPTGLPMPDVPPLELIPSVALDAFTITMVTYSISMSMALIFAAKAKYEVDANQELLALGASNVFGAFFCCAPMCASLSRSSIQYQAGARTQLTCVVSAVLVLAVLLWVGPVFEVLPRCVLASIIVVSLKSMVWQISDLRKFWRLSKLDAVVWLAAFLVTVLINIDIGLAAGVVASIGTLFCRSQFPYTCLLGRVDATDLYVDCKRYRAAEEIPGIRIFHYCGGLNFATKNLFRSTLFRKIGYPRCVELTPDEDNNITKSDSFDWKNKLSCVIVDATALSYVDAPGIKALIEVQRELATSNITVLLAGANAPVLEMVERYNSLEKETNRLHLDVFPTVHDAVVYYKVKETKKESTKETAITVST